MEITFTRVINYSLQVEGTDLTKLAKALSTSKAKLAVKIDEDEFTDEERDALAEWVMAHEPMWEISSEDDIEDMEVYAS